MQDICRHRHSEHLPAEVKPCLHACRCHPCRGAGGLPIRIFCECMPPTLDLMCMQVPFTPRRWRPTNPDVPQVPFTFALRPAPPRAPGKRARSMGSGEDPGKGLGKRPRVRKLLPTAWTTGEATASGRLCVHSRGCFRLMKRSRSQSPNSAIRYSHCHPRYV